MSVLVFVGEYDAEEEEEGLEGVPFDDQVSRDCRFTKVIRTSSVSTPTPFATSLYIHLCLHACFPLTQNQIP